MNKRNSYLMAGLVMTGILTVLIVMGIFWTPYDPNAMAAGPKLSPPSLAHLMGTDSFGRDIFSRVLKGAGTTYGIALCTVAIGAVCGTMLGAVTGYFGGIVDDMLMRLGDVLTAFPSILLALVVISLLGPGKTGNVILALGLVFIPSFARITRTAFASLRDANYVKSARLMGAGHLRIMFLHILPNTRQVLLPTLVIGFNNAVLAEASMSYLGIGVKPPDVSLGYMLSESQSYMARAPWYMLTVGGVIVLLLDWRVALIAWGLFAALWLLTRYVSLGSVAATASMPVSVFFLLGHNWLYTVLSAAVAALVIWCHRGNIQRLLHGTEKKFQWHVDPLSGDGGNT